MKRRHLVIPITLLLLGVSIAPAHADDSRRGFIFGLGGGLAARASVRGEADPIWGDPVDESSSGFAYQLVIGAGFSDHDWLVYEGNVLARTSKTWDLSVGQGFNGATWYHAFGDRGKAWVGALGAGAYVTDVFDSYISISFGQPAPLPPPDDLGFGWLIGAGRQVGRRVSVMGYLSGGSIDASPYNYDLTHTSVLLQYIWD